MAFGNKVASDSRDSGGGEWIRYFKDDETQLRILPAEATNKRGETVYGTAAWPQEYEHYDRSISMSFPCTEDDECVGCNSSDKEVRSKSRKIYFFALDEDGVPRIYKCGPQLYKRLKMKEQRQLARKPKNLQPLSDRDYIILKSGKGMDTEYDAEASEEAYEIDFPGDDELPDLVDSLTTAYEDAVEAYEGYVDDDEEEDEPVRARSRKAAAKKTTSRRKPAEPEDDEDEDEEEDEPAPRKKAAAKKSTSRRKAPEPEEDDEDEEEEEEAPAPRKRAAAKKTASRRKAAEPEEDDEEEGEESGDLSFNELASASTEELRAYLTKHSIEFPPRAPRKRLVEIAQENPPY